MADIELARSVLRGLSAEITEPEVGNFHINYRNRLFRLAGDEIDAYVETRIQIRKPTETQLFIPGHYEHVVQSEGDFRRRIRRDEQLSLRNQDGTTVIDLGKASSLFCLSLTDVDRLDRNLRRFALFGLGMARVPGNQVQHFTDIFRIYTVKVATDSASPLGRSISRLNDLAEAGIFHLAYGHGISVSFTQSWERTYYWLGRKEQNDIQFPLRTYNPELVRYYTLALASESLVLAFLALYKILEFFYTSASENVLHQKLKELLVAPDFLPTKTKKLRDLVKIIRTFDNRLDEIGALKLVLAEYFDRAELRQWVETYEAENEPHFTVDFTLFGTTTRIDLNDGSIIGNLASRIYLIRNALVHNKEGEVSRFVPYTGQEEILQKEIQILVFIAEQLIIKSGKDLA
jgi:hypothetical protein